MPIEIKWHIPYRVIDERAWGDLTQADTVYHSENIIRLMNEALAHDPEQIVCLLYDDTETTSMPPIYLMLKEIVPLMHFKNRGTMYHITSNDRLRSIINLTGYIMKFPIRTFSTREDALRALEADLSSAIT